MDRYIYIHNNILKAKLNFKITVLNFQKQIFRFKKIYNYTKKAELNFIAYKWIFKKDMKILKIINKLIIMHKLNR